jgi:hypothetical protein
MGVLVSRSSAPVLPIPTHVAGKYYGSQIATYVQDNASIQNFLTGMPFYVPSTGAYNEIAVRVATGAGGSTIRLGIRNYTASGPGTLLLEAGTVDSSTSGLKTITISQTLAAGWWYLEGVAQGGAPTVPWVTNSLPVIGTDEAAAESLVNGAYYVFPVSGALPAAAPSAASINLAGGTFRILLRKS